MGPPPKLLSSINQLEDPLVIHDEDKVPVTFHVSREKDHFVLDVSEEDKKKQINIHPQANMVSIDATFYLMNASEFRKASTTA